MIPEDVLNFIQESLEDENKILTFKHLSFSLNVPLRDAKKYLHEYAESNKNLNVTYCFVGHIADPEIPNSKILKVQLANKNEKIDIIKSFISEPSCHVYSIQKSLLENFPLLYSFDYDIIKRLTLNDKDLFSISHENVFTRTRKYIVNSQQQQPVETKKENSQTPDSQNAESQNSDTISKKSDGSISFFTKTKTAKNNIKNSETSASSKNEDKKKVESKPAKKQVTTNKDVKSLTSLFNNHAKKPKPESQSEDSPNLETVEKQETILKTTSTKTIKSANKKTSDKKSKTIKRELPAKQRKRIIVESSSDNENSDSDDDNEKDDYNIMDHSEEDPSQNIATDTQPSQSSSSSHSNKRKASDSESDDIENNSPNEQTNKDVANEPTFFGGVKKKKVLETSTYLDEDGFMVTEKVLQSVDVPVNSQESDVNEDGRESDENHKVEKTENGKKPKNGVLEIEKKKKLKSDNLVVDKKQPQNNKKKQTNNQKQSSLMNFFTKK